MPSPRTVRPQTASAEITPVPLTIEGYSVLHQMMRVRWAAWRQLRPAEKTEIVDEASSALAQMEQNSAGQSALYSLIGHKGDLMLIHFRRSFDELNRAELQLARLRLSDYLEATTSYLSVIELGLYESTIKAYRELAGSNPTLKNGIERSRIRWRGRKRPWLPGCFRSFPSTVMSVSIPWIGAAERTRTGTHCPSKSVRGR